MHCRLAAVSTPAQAVLERQRARHWQLLLQQQVLVLVISSSHPAAAAGQDLKSPDRVLIYGAEHNEDFASGWHLRPDQQGCLKVDTAILQQLSGVWLKAASPQACSMQATLTLLAKVSLDTAASRRWLPQKQDPQKQAAGRQSSPHRLKCPS